MEIRHINGVGVAFLEASGPLLSTEQDALDILGSLYGQEAEIVVIPTSRLAPEFFQLRTKLAGLFVQKILNYRYRLAILGDISSHIEASTALRDYVRESARNRDVIFVRDEAELVSRL